MIIIIIINIFCSLVLEQPLSPSTSYTGIPWWGIFLYKYSLLSFSIVLSFNTKISIHPSYLVLLIAFGATSVSESITFKFSRMISSLALSEGTLHTLSASLPTLQLSQIWSKKSWAIWSSLCLRQLRSSGFAQHEKQKVGYFKSFCCWHAGWERWHSEIIITNQQHKIKATNHCCTFVGDFPWC